MAAGLSFPWPIHSQESWDESLSEFSSAAWKQNLKPQRSQRSRRTSLRSLRPLRLKAFLGYPLLDLFQRAAQILHRVGDAEPQVAFPELTEGCPRKASHTGFFEQRVRERLRFPSRRADVWENIERAFRHTARESPNLIQRRDEHVAPPLKFAAYLFDRALISAQSLDARDLRETRGT